MELALALLQEKGVNGFSFADIANLIGIRKASIHYYFPTKLDLVKKVLDQYIADFFAALAAACEDAADLEGCLRSYAGLFRQNLENDRKLCLCSMLATESACLDEALNAEVKAFYEDNLDWLKKTLAHHQFPAEKIDMHAKDFFVSVQGAQLVARSASDVAFYDELISEKVRGVLSAY